MSLQGADACNFANVGNELGEEMSEGGDRGYLLVLLPRRHNKVEGRTEWPPIQTPPEGARKSESSKWID